jgi:perosamine synthetase
MCLLIEPGFGKTRDEVAEGLRAVGIDSRPFFIPLHTLPPFRQESVARGEQLPITERLARTGINLPTFPEMGRGEVERVCDAVRSLRRRP